jgi:uncharacterized protein YeaO (DUF488 family)
VKKISQEIKDCLKGMASSTDCGNGSVMTPPSWDDFCNRYQQSFNPWQPIIEVARHGLVTLTYSSHDAEHNTPLCSKLS